MLMQNTPKHKILYTQRPKTTLIEKFRLFTSQYLGSIIFFLCMAFICYWIYEQASEQYRWQWGRIWRYVGVFTDSGFKAGPILDGLLITLLLTLSSLFLAIIIGLILCFARLSLSPVAVVFSRQVVSLIRNTPLLIQLLLFYYVFAPIFSFSNFTSAVFTLALFEGVYLSEIFRAGITSLPKAQWEAAFSLGMSTPMTLKLIILPQALGNILPTFSGQLISLIKDTSLVSAIAVTDLTQKARALISETFLSFETWILVAIFYFLLTTLVSIPAFIYTKSHSKNARN